MKNNKQRLTLSLLISIAMMPLISCGADASAFFTSPTPTSTQTCTPTSTVAPTATATLLPTPAAATPTAVPPSVEYDQQFLAALPNADASCLPDKTKDDIGIYIYDLKKDRELVSINADVPFQFASAFKGPVLVYFLSRCKRYWDTESPEWDAYFTDPASARDIAYYTSPEYKTLISQHFSDVRNWDNVEAFFNTNRFAQNGQTGVMDKRYFVLSKVYSMAARSNNAAAGEMLQFVYENCQPEVRAQLSSTDACYRPNAISQFNLWFNEFSGITYQDGETQRGLYKYDVVLEKDSSGKQYEAMMATYGLEDRCAIQTAQLSCSASAGASVWTARDFFKFYNALYHLADDRVRNAALSMLMIDNPGPARGNLKNLTRKMGAVSMSKNGHAYFILGSINTDAGILYYQETPFIVVTLGYDAQPSLSLLYGDYTPEGTPSIDQSLIRDLLEEYLAAGG